MLETIREQQAETKQRAEAITEWQTKTRGGAGHSQDIHGGKN